MAGSDKDFAAEPVLGDRCPTWCGHSWVEAALAVAVVQVSVLAMDIWSLAVCAVSGSAAV